jgi:hypothetical protein
LDERGALIPDEADEIEEEREDLEELSETIDSGLDTEETDVANEDRRLRLNPWGDTVVWPCHLSVTCAAHTEEACDIAYPIDEIFNIFDAALTAGVPNPTLCGVNRGVGNRPRAGAGLLGG